MHEQLVSANEMARSIHQQNIDAGWWKKDQSGNTEPRNIGELLCLVHSEIDEADSNRMDEKLPHRREFEVELADAAIRIFDILGFFGTDIEKEYARELPIEYPDVLHIMPTYARVIWLMEMHKLVSHSMEAFRKGRQTDGCLHLCDVLRMIRYCSLEFDLDVAGAIVEKRAYNAQRPDHKLENRQKVGGKAF